MFFAVLHVHIMLSSTIGFNCEIILHLQDGIDSSPPYTRAITEEYRKRLGEQKDDFDERFVIGEDSNDTRQ
jgi:hypothetical protein